MATYLFLCFCLLCRTELILQKRLFSQRTLDFWLQDKMPEYYFDKKLMIWNIEKISRRERSRAPEGPGWGTTVVADKLLYRFTWSGGRDGRGVGWLFLMHSKKLSIQASLLQASCFASVQHSFPFSMQGFCHEEIWISKCYKWISW